jgi:hypothetical protein
VTVAAAALTEPANFGGQRRDVVATGDRRRENPDRAVRTAIRQADTHPRLPRVLQVLCEVRAVNESGLVPSSGARWARNSERYWRLVTLGERLKTIRTDMRELGVLDDLKRIERRHAVYEASWRRVRQREAALSEVERLKQVAAQISKLSESAIDALADNSSDLDVRDWLSRAPDICAIAERAETALLEKRRRAPSLRVQPWLIAELAGIYVQAYGVDFPAGSRRGPGTRFVQTCAEYIQLVEIERELRALDRNDRTPNYLYLDPPPLSGETIKTLLRTTKAKKR